MPILSYLSFGSSLLPTLAAIINFKRLDGTLKMIAAFFTISFLIDFSEWLYYIGKIKMKNDYPLLHLSIFISFLFYIWIYYRLFYYIIFKFATIIIGAIALFTTIFFAFNNSIWAYPTWGNTSLSFFMIVVCLLFFQQIFKKQEGLLIEYQPFFWFNSGILVYSAINIFLFMLFSRLNFSADLYVIHLITSIVTNFLFAIALLCKPQMKI
jgi:hypothetical protein